MNPFYAELRAMRVQDFQAAMAAMDPETRRDRLGLLGVDEVESLLEVSFLGGDTTYRDQVIDRLAELDPERAAGPRLAAAERDQRPTETAPPADHAADLAARMRPAVAQVDIATAMLAAAPGADAVLVPLAMPGKDEGVWVAGQPVEHPPGFWLAATNDRVGPVSYRRARDDAEDAADRWLAGRAGVAAYASISPDGTWAVFEGVRRTPATARRIVHRAELVPYDLGHDYWRTPDSGTRYRCHSHHQGRQTTFTVLFIGPEGQGRAEYQGTQVPGPRASLIAEPTVIASHPLPRPTEVDLSVGDRLDIGGFVFEVRDDKPGDNPQLSLI